MNRFAVRILRLAAGVLWLALAGGAGAQPPLVFPLPQQLKVTGEDFTLDERLVLLVPESPAAGDLHTARLLAGVLADRHALAVPTLRTAHLPQGRRAILMGTIDNPLIKEALSADELASARRLKPEGYLLRVSKDRVTIAGRDDAGTFYGMQTLRQLVRRDPQRTVVRGAQVTDWPHASFRGLRVYVPGPEHLPFFHRFLKDFAALYKFNRVILEMNACMRLNRHPELNAGWLEFAKTLTATRRERPDGPGGQNQDSAHYDAGDGAIVEQADMAELVRAADDQFIEVIPEIPTLTHAYYLLTRHRELAEIQSAEWPDTYCPSNPGVYPLVFDVLDEYIDVMHPKTIHLGHDEWRMPVAVCPRCQGKDTGELFAQDVNRLHDHLALKGVRMAIWGDHLVENVRGRGPQRKKSSGGYEYRVPGALTAQEVISSIPKDILIFNWFWKEQDSQPPRLIMGEVDDKLLTDWGFKQVYGNFEPDIENYARRSANPSVLGGAASSWAASTEANFGKDLMIDFLGVANLVWSSHWPAERELTEMVQARMPEVRRSLGGRSTPREEGDPATPAAIGPAANAGAEEAFFGADLKGLAGPGGSSRALVAMTGAGDGSHKLAPGKPIAIGKDASSLVFLHGCARPARNDKAYRGIWDFDDTAELLGWYEVVYEDGLIASIPIRYGVNILEWQGWPRAGEKTYCYGADPVPSGTDAAGKEKRLWSYEWVNPRPGKVIREVRLKGAELTKRAAAGPKKKNDKKGDEEGLGSRRGRGNGNAIALVGLSVVEKRSEQAAMQARTSTEKN